MTKKTKIPTAAEVRIYREKEAAYLRDCIEQDKTFVITGPKFQGETIWRSVITLPLLEAAESVGTPKEEIWELCRKIAQVTHAPVTRKEYERMLPFAEKASIVDAVLQLLKTYIPPFETQYWLPQFDIKGYYYCLALISLSDYRKADCEAQLWHTVEQFLARDRNLDAAPVLLRNMNVLGKSRPFLIPMQEKLETACNNIQK